MSPVRYPIRIKPRSSGFPSTEIPQSYTLIFSLTSRSSNTTIRRLPLTSMRRIFIGASQFTCVCAINRPSKNIVKYAMFSGLPDT